jgi:glycerol-3-phosphate acyltransferase PlsY
MFEPSTVCMVPRLDDVEQAVSLIVSYLIGSLSFGIMVASMRGVDIRSVGSGNPGTSNILRTLGRKDAVIVLAGDALKGGAAALIGQAWVGDEFGWVTLFVAVIGHSFPIWHRFRGGKSVATAIGGVAVLAPWIGLVLAVVWISILLVWKTASVGSLVVMAMLVPLVAVSSRSGAVVAWSAAIAGLVLVRHWSNIKRLWHSDEQTVIP